MLRELEGEHLVDQGAGALEIRSLRPESPQLGLFAAAPHPAVERLAQLDVNAMTPLEALTTLASLVEQTRGKQA
jgi:hypothetical protein